MKKTLIFILAILIVACSESSNSDDDSSNSIIGIWRLVAEVEYCATDSEIDFYNSCNSQTTLEFTASEVIGNHYDWVDGVVCEYDYSILPYVIKDNIIMLSDSEDYMCGQYTWDCFQIIELSANTLIFGWETDYPEGSIYESDYCSNGELIRMHGEKYERVE